MSSAIPQAVPNSASVSGTLYNPSAGIQSLGRGLQSFGNNQQNSGTINVGSGFVPQGYQDFGSGQPITQKMGGQFGQQNNNNYQMMQMMRYMQSLPTSLQYPR